jgi:hypothetical protein
MKDLLPRTEIQLPIRHCRHHLAPHHLAREVCVGVILTGAIMPVLGRRFVRDKTFQPGLVIVVQTAFVKIDLNTPLKDIFSRLQCGFFGSNIE